jgi:hypothetical protein
VEEEVGSSLYWEGEGGEKHNRGKRKRERKEVEDIKEINNDNRMLNREQDKGRWIRVERNREKFKKGNK